MATLRDVATRARVSIKTVSRVVNGEPGVTEATRARVDRAVQALGYVPSVAARRLVRQRSFVLGVVYQNKSWNWLSDFQRGAIEEARRHGYEILMHPSNVEEPEDRALLGQTVGQGSVDGLVLTPPCGDFEPVVRTLEKRSTPYVRIAPTRRVGPRPTVSADDRRGAREMGEHLVALGHRRIAFIAGGAEQRSSQDRLEGFREALAGAGVRWRSDHVFRGDFSFESGVEIGRRVLALERRPTAIFASNDDMAAGVLSACHEHGVRVPDGISVAGFDDVALAHQVWPPLTTVHQPTEAIAALAVRTLIGALDGNEPSEAHATLPTSLVERASTGPPCS